MKPIYVPIAITIILTTSFLLFSSAQRTPTAQSVIQKTPTIAPAQSPKRPESKVLLVSVTPSSPKYVMGTTLRVQCTVTNITDHKLILRLGDCHIFMWPKLIVVDTCGSFISHAKDSALDPGESKTIPVEITQGQEIPFLNMGNYQMRVSFRYSSPEPGGLVEGRTMINVTDEINNNTKRDAVQRNLTVDQIIKIAREHSEANKPANPQKIDYGSYRIRNELKVWNVQFPYKGPDLYGEQSVNIDKTSHAPRFFECFLVAPIKE